MGWVALAVVVMVWVVVAVRVREAASVLVVTAVMDPVALSVPGFKTLSHVTLVPLSVFCAWNVPVP
jgi:hypothetical protein